MNDKCLNCKSKVDNYGEDFLELQIIRNYQSQGYPDQFTVGKINLCLNCLPENIKELIKTNIPSCRLPK